MGCYVLALCCFICSGLSKEQAFVLPLSLLLVDWFIRRDMKSTDVWFEKLPFVILSAGFALLTLDLQGHRVDAVIYTPFQRFLFGCYSLFEYMTKSLLPVQLNYLYPFPILPGSDDMPVRFYVYPVLVICLFVVLYSYRKNRMFIFGSLFFIIHLLLSLHIVAMPRLGIVADRYLYLSLPGILLLLSYGVVSWMEKEHRLFPRILLLLSMFLYSVYLMGYTCHYSRQWKDTDTVKHYLRSFCKNEDKETDGRENHD